jgi:hypothetical protein
MKCFELHAHFSVSKRKILREKTGAYAIGYKLYFRKVTLESRLIKKRLRHKF